LKTKRSSNLNEKIHNKNAKIAVLGLGYVGLPTAVLFASLGFHVKGIDVNPKIVDQLNKCAVQTTEQGVKELVEEAHQQGLLSATSDSKVGLGDSDIVIVCVQTPFDISGTANLSYLQSACQSIALNLKKERLVIIQSTVPPKTLENLIIPLLEETSKLKCGEDFWIAYCPERLSPGNGLHELKTNMRIIGANSKESAELCKSLLGTATKGELLLSSISSAEISKLAENTYRYVNIAFANELAQICKQLDVDVTEVIKLANTHPRVNILQPGCGAGGPCLSKDTKLLLSSTKEGSFKPEVIPAAIAVNTNMPNYVAKLAADALIKKGKNVQDSKIAIFGTSYKGNVDDPRNSPAEGIISHLKKMKATIVVFDPKCSESFGVPKADSATNAACEADCIVLTTDHREFLALNLAQIKKQMKDNPIIIDAIRAINPAEARLLGFEYVTISWA
jgi:UDP-N-acetyl-D-mannosaminuronic acid dehydrogenase